MPYAELHCHSAFSFLDGASHPQELAGEAAEQGHTALALTDHDGLHGAMEMAQALKRTAVRHITGAEMTMEDGSHLTLLCETRQGYRNLCRLITEAYADTRSSAQPRGAADPVTTYDVAGAPRRRAWCASRAAPATAPWPGRSRPGATPRRRPPRGGCCAMFGPDHLRIEIQRPFARHDRRRNRLLCQLAERLGVPAVATGNVHAHSRARTRLQDAMVAVRPGQDAWTSASPSGAATPRTRWPRPRPWPPASPSTRTRWRSRAGWPSGWPST